MSSSSESSSAQRSAGDATKSSIWTGKRIAILVLLVLVIVFGLLNSQKVTVHWGVATTETPLIVVIAVTLVIGLAVGYGAAKYRARGASAASAS